MDELNTEQKEALYSALPLIEENERKLSRRNTRSGRTMVAHWDGLGALLCFGILLALALAASGIVLALLYNPTMPPEGIVCEEGGTNLDLECIPTIPPEGIVCEEGGINLDGECLPPSVEFENVVVTDSLSIPKSVTCPDGPIGTACLMVNASDMVCGDGNVLSNQCIPETLRVETEILSTLNVTDINVTGIISPRPGSYCDLPLSLTCIPNIPSSTIICDSELENACVPANLSLTSLNVDKLTSNCTILRGTTTIEGETTCDIGGSINSTCLNDIPSNVITCNSELDGNCIPDTLQTVSLDTTNLTVSGLMSLLGSTCEYPLDDSCFTIGTITNYTFQYPSTSPLSISSITYITVATETIFSPDEGTYRIGWYVEQTSNSAGRDVRARVVIDGGIELGEVLLAQSAGEFGFWSGFSHNNFTIGTHVINLQVLKSMGGGSDPLVRRARLEIWRTI